MYTIHNISLSLSVCMCVSECIPITIQPGERVVYQNKCVLPCQYYVHFDWNHLFCSHSPYGLLCHAAPFIIFPICVYAVVEITPTYYFSVALSGWISSRNAMLPRLERTVRRDVALQLQTKKNTNPWIRYLQLTYYIATTRSFRIRSHLILFLLVYCHPRYADYLMTQCWG